MPFIVPVIEAVVAIGAAVGSFVAGAGIIGQGLILAGIGIASTYLIQALTPKASDASQVSGVNFERQYGTNVSRQVACGLVGLAGHDVYVNTFAEANSDLQQIYVVSDYPTTALTRVAIGGVWVGLGADPGNGYLPVISGGTFAGNGMIAVKFVNGRQTTAEGRLLEGANPAERWAAQNVGMGVSYIIIDCVYQKDDNNSFPDFFFEVQGAPLYDWRKDSTNGGSGSHRWGDINTHEYSTNPIVMEYNYRRGLAINNDPFCGMFMDASDLPVDKFSAAANICSELQGDGLPRYQCSIFLDCMRTHSDNLQSLALSCGAMQIDSIDGSWPLVGSDQTVVMEFTDADLISTASNFKRTEKQSMSTLVNSVAGNYPEPSQLWSMIGYDQQTSSTFVTLDRRTRDISMDFPQVPSLRQADQLAWIYLYENRFETTATVTLRPRFQVLEAGDWVNWNSARYHGTKTFIVSGKQLLNTDSADGPRNVILSLQERNGEIYTGITPTVPILPFPPGTPVYMSEVVSLAALPVTVTGSGGVFQAAIRVSWAAPTDVTVVEIDVMYYPTNDAASIIHKVVKADQTVVILAEGVVGLTNYTVRTKLITNPPRTLTFDAGVTVTTLASAKLSITDFNDDVKYQTTTLLNKFSDRLDNMEAIIAATDSNANARQWNNKQMVQRQLMSVTGSVTASITEVMTVATTTDASLASYKLTTDASITLLDNQLNTPVTGLSAKVTANSTAIVDLTGSLGSYVTTASATITYATLTGLGTTNGNVTTLNNQLNTPVTGLSATVTTNSTAIASINAGLLASWSMTLNVAGHISGLKLLSDGTVAAFIIESNVFQIANPSAFGGAAKTVFTLETVGGVTQMALDGNFVGNGVVTALQGKFGTLSALSANMGTLTLGLMQSPDGKFLIDLTNKRIVISD